MMKQFIRYSIILALLLVLHPSEIQAKWVKFSVNMQGWVISPAGMHIVGDFQTLAGFPGGDWNSATTPMFQEVSDTNIYSVVVNIPAFSKYEYKFANGDQFYEVEFVPVESRVGYNFNDSRWIYIDSLAADTQMVGPLRFSGNAPMGQYLMRFLVDMHEQPVVSPLGVHVAGDYNGWTTPQRLYSFVNGIWEHITYLDSTAGNTAFIYYNGNVSGDEEMVQGSCTANSYRFLSVPKDTVLPVVCFGSCAACVTSSIVEGWIPRIEIFPNPARESALVRLSNHFGDWTMQVRDSQGRMLQEIKGSGEQAIRLAQGEWRAGMYFVTVMESNGNTATQKLIFQ
jgi:hypothetical protein